MVQSTWPLRAQLVLMGVMFMMVVTMMMKVRVVSWGLVILLNHGAGALWVDLNIIFVLALLQSPQGCLILFPFLGGAWGLLGLS